MKFPSFDYFLRKLDAKSDFKWMFTEYDSAKNGHGRVALCLSVTVKYSVEKQEWHVRVCDISGNYAGECWEGTFDRSHSASFFISALYTSTHDLPEGKVEES